MIDLISSSIAAGCNIVLNYLFIRVLGILGAVVATSIAHGFQFGFHWMIAKKISTGEYPFKLSQFVPGFVAVCVTCILYWFTREMWWIRWGIGAGLGIYLIIKIFKRGEIF